MSQLPSKPRDSHGPRYHDDGVPPAAMGTFVVVAVACLGVLSQLEGLERFYVGVLLAVLTLAVFLTAYARKLGSREAVILGGAAVAVCLVGGGFAWSGWHEHEQSLARAKVSSLITSAANAETAWYQDPTRNHASDLEHYYQADESGLVAIEQVIGHFRREHCRWGPLAHEVVSVQSVAISGRSATAQTSEFYHQPRVCTGPPPATPALGDRNAKVTYELVQTHAGWRIISTSAIYLK